MKKIRGTWLSGIGCCRLVRSMCLSSAVLCFRMSLGKMGMKNAVFVNVRGLCAIPMDGNVYPSASVLLIYSREEEEREEQN